MAGETTLRLEPELVAVLSDLVERHYTATRWRSRPGAPPPDEVLWVRANARRGMGLEAKASTVVLERLRQTIRWCGDQNQVGIESRAWLERLLTAIDTAGPPA